MVGYGYLLGMAGMARRQVMDTFPTPVDGSYGILLAPRVQLNDVRFEQLLNFTQVAHL